MISYILAGHLAEGPDTWQATCMVAQLYIKSPLLLYLCSLASTTAPRTRLYSTALGVGRYRLRPFALFVANDVLSRLCGETYNNLYNRSSLCFLSLSISFFLESSPGWGFPCLLLLLFLPILRVDVLSGSTSSSVHHSGVLEEWAGGETWWNQRTTVMLFTTIFILVPLVSVRHLVLFVVVTAAIVIYKLAAGRVSTPKLFPDFDTDASTILTYFSVVPVLVTAYICHHSVHPILNELERASDSERAIRLSLGLCTSIYVTTSVLGYLLFGENTLSDVLSNFDTDLEVPHGAVLSAIVRVGYAVHLMLVYPLLNFSLRLNLDGLLFPRAEPLSLDTWRFFSLNFGLVVASFLGASFVPDIWDAFQFTGSTSAVCLGFVFPGFLVLRDTHKIASKKEKLAAWFMVLLAAGASVVALTGDIYELF